MSVPRELLEAWPDLWRYPELYARAKHSDQQIGSEEAADLVVRSLADPRPAAAAVAAMMEAGEFGLAELLVDDPEFARALGNEVDSLRADLELARKQWRRRSEVRTIALAARARTAGLDDQAATAIESGAQQGVTDIDLPLDAWEARIADAEAAARHALSADFLLKLSRQPDQDDPQVTAWRSSFERSLAAGQFDIARALLEAGPSDGPADTPVVVPRRPPWPWNVPLEEALAWFAAGSRVPGASPPTEFFAKWRPESDDEQAAALLKVLTEMYETGEPDEALARAFARTLDAFLGYEGEASYEAQDVHVGVRTKLHGLNDVRLRTFRFFARQPVELWIEKPGHEAPDEAVGALRFSLVPTRTAREGVHFDPLTVLRLAGDRSDRRTNFFRELTLQLALQDAIRDDVESLAIQPLDEAELRVYLAWLLDLLNVHAEPGVPDVLVYLSGGRADLAVHVLREVLGGVSRRATLSISTLADGWHSPALRVAADTHLMKPIYADAKTTAALGASYLLGARPGGVTSEREVVDAFEAFWDDALSAEEVREALAKLCELGFLEDIESQYRIPVSGVARFIFDEVDDAERLVEDGIRRAGRLASEGSS